MNFLDPPLQCNFMKLAFTGRSLIFTTKRICFYYLVSELYLFAKLFFLISFAIDRFVAAETELKTFDSFIIA